MVAAIETRTRVRLVEDETEKLIDWARQNEHDDATIFEKSQAFARRMGAHYRSDGLTEVVFWAPRLLSEVMQEHDIYLEVLTPVTPINPTIVRQTIEFHRDRVYLVQHNEFFGAWSRAWRLEHAIASARFIGCVTSIATNDSAPSVT